MLHADKLAFEANLAQDLVAIQMKELDYLYKNLANLATSSAVLVGFGFSGVTAFASDDLTTRAEHAQCFGIHLDEAEVILNATAVTWPRCVWWMTSDLVDAAWTMTTALGLGLNLIALFISTITCITGPGMALRGPEGSLTVALRHMEHQNKRALRFFGRGMVAFSSTLLLLGAQAFVQLAFAKALVVIVVGAYVIRKISYYGNDIGARFHLACGRAVRGEFDTGFSRKFPASGKNPFDSGSSDPWETNMSEVDLQTRLEALALPKLGRKWRPEGHTKMTPLMRLDKLIVLPYHASHSLRVVTEHGKTHITGPDDFKAARSSALQQRESLIRKGQGTPNSSDRNLRSAAEPKAAAGGGDALTFDVLEQISQMAVAAGVAYAPDEKDDDGGWSWWPFGRGAERPDSAERERRLTALGQPTSRRAPPKSKKNVKLDVEMGGANATL